MKIETPEVMEKQDSFYLDYKKLTFKDFLIIQEKAQEVANNIGYAVYLVGSALTKHLPRDIDLAIIIPYEDYLKKYGFNNSDTFATCLYDTWSQSFEDTKPLLLLRFGEYNIDLKICPDTWWPEKEKNILAKPKEVKVVE